VHYQFRVRGRLGETLLAAFPELRAQPLRSETLLAGQLPDQAALFSVLGRIEALGLELLVVLRTEDHSGVPPSRWHGKGSGSKRQDPFGLKNSSGLRSSRPTRSPPI